MDPNLKRKDACVVCGGFLPKRKSRYCSRYCARRFRRWRTPGLQTQATFFTKVREPVWVKRDEQAQAKARALVAAGAVLALKRDERILAVGVPLRSEDEIAAQLRRRLDERSERLAIARREERIAHRDDERQAKRLRRAITRTNDDEKHDDAAKTAGRT